MEYDLTDDNYHNSFYGDETFEGHDSILLPEPIEIDDIELDDYQNANVVQKTNKEFKSEDTKMDMSIIIDNIHSEELLHTDASICQENVDFQIKASVDILQPIQNVAGDTSPEVTGNPRKRKQVFTVKSQDGLAGSSKNIQSRKKSAQNAPVKDFLYLKDPTTAETRAEAKRIIKAKQIHHYHKSQKEEIQQLKEALKRIHIIAASAQSENESLKKRLLFLEKRDKVREQEKLSKQRQQ